MRQEAVEAETEQRKGQAHSRDPATPV